MTFNLCLGRDFEASGLTFCGQIGTTSHRQFSCQYQHVKGWAVAHLGTKRHGADDITLGERNNLIVVRFDPACLYNHHFRQTLSVLFLSSLPRCLSISVSVSQQFEHISNR